MQFFRRWYSPWEFDMYNNEHSLIPQDLSNFGFVMEDGSPIPDYMPNTASNYTMYYFKWKYDNGNIITHGPGLSWEANVTGSNRDLAFRQSNNTAFHTVFMDIDYGYPQSIVFIPLKNRGFQMYRLLSDNDYTPIDRPPKIPIPGFTYNTSNVGAPSITSFYNNVTNTYNYIGIDNKLGSVSTDRQFDIMDYRNGLIVSPPLYDLNESRTNIRQNVCTLIKYPFNNGFISNLFIISTAPNADLYITSRTTKESKIFSFGGRNFLYLTLNLALELPSN